MVLLQSLLKKRGTQSFIILIALKYYTTIMWGWQVDIKIIKVRLGKYSEVHILYYLFQCLIS